MKKKHTFLFVILLFGFTTPEIFSQTNSKSPFDILDEYIELRKSFPNSEDSKKPASFSYTKSEGKNAEIEIDAAIMYKSFNGGKIGIAPVVGFQYNTSSSDKKEKLYTGVAGYYDIGNVKTGMLKIESNIFFVRDFNNVDNLLDANITLLPRLEEFIIPIYNLSGREFKYDGSDDKWYFAINPSVGLSYEFVIDDERKSYVKDLHTSYRATLVLKRYYLEFDIFGYFTTELENRLREEKEYGARLNIFLDKKESISINLSYSKKKKNTDTRLKEDVKIGFGLKI